MLSVSYKGSNQRIRKDLAELVEFMREVDQLFNGFVDNWLCQLLNVDSSSDPAASSNMLAQEYDKSIKQRLIEQFESLSRIPFINNSHLFKKFFEIDLTTMNASAENSFEKGNNNQNETGAAQGNPFMAERRLTESVPPKNTRMTLQGEQPQPCSTVPFDYNSKDNRMSFDLAG